MNFQNVTGVVLAALALQACTIYPRSPGGPPVEDRSTQSDMSYPESTGRVPRSSAYASTSSFTRAVPLPIASLLAQANRHRHAAEYGKAVATVERAMRIAPRNALVWYRLAEIRVDEQKYPLAESLAIKSISLAGSDRALKNQNWILIASLRQSTGDVGGAREARIRAREYQ